MRNSTAGRQLAGRSSESGADKHNWRIRDWLAAGDLADEGRDLGFEGAELGPQVGA